jgi:hypothetical protein
METNSANPGRYALLHDLFIVLGYLAIMLTLDVIYGTLLFHAFAQKTIAAHRERAAARRLAQQAAAAVTPAISASSALVLDMDLDTDMQQAA